MAGKGTRFIYNEWCWIGYLEGEVETLEEVTEAQIDEAIEMTSYFVSLDASAQGNVVPTPDLGSLFERSVDGTSQASFQASFYRYDAEAKDVAWNTLKRATKGTFLVCRYGVPKGSKPQIGDLIEAWPTSVTSRKAGPMSSNTAATFDVTCSVPNPPLEDGYVTA